MVVGGWGRKDGLRAKGAKWKRLGLLYSTRTDEL